MPAQLLPCPQVPPQVKYRLPSDPTVWVDVVDDEDVQVSGQGQMPCMTPA